MIEADENGNLVIPIAARPGTRYAVERNGEAVTVRPDTDRPASGWERQTAEERVAWLRDFIARLPPGTGLKVEDISREDLY